MFMKETESGKKISIGRIIGALVIIAIIVLAVKLIKNRIEMYKYYHTYHTLDLREYIEDNELYVIKGSSTIYLKENEGDVFLKECGIDRELCQQVVWYMSRDERNQLAMIELKDENDSAKVKEILDRHAKELENRNGSHVTVSVGSEEHPSRLVVFSATGVSEGTAWDSAFDQMTDLEMWENELFRETVYLRGRAFWPPEE